MPLPLPGAVVQHTLPRRDTAFWPLHLIPTAVFPLVPVPILVAAVNIAVSSGINVVAPLADKAAAVGSTTADHSSLIAACYTGGVAGLRLVKRLVLAQSSPRCT